MPSFEAYPRVVVPIKSAGIVYAGLYLACVMWAVASVFLFHQHLRIDTDPDMSLFVRVKAPQAASHLHVDHPHCVAAGSAGCHVLDELEIADASSGHRSAVATITTFVRERVEARTCGFREQCPGAVWKAVGEEVSWFTSLPEAFVLRVNHTVASTFGEHLRSDEMQGALSAGDGPPAVLSREGQTDVLPLQQLLEAAGLPSLDHAPDGGGPARRRGAVVGLHLQYTNLPPPNVWSPYTQAVRYDLSAHRVPKAEYRSIRTRALDPSSFAAVLQRFGVDANTTDAAHAWRIRTKAYGVQVLISQGGSIGEWTWQTALTSVVSSIILLVSVPFAAVDCWYTLRSKAYRSAVYFPPYKQE